MTQRTDGEAPDMHPKRLATQQDFIYVGDKDRKKLQKIAWDAGWFPKKTKKGIMWQAPDEVGQVLLHGSDSDHHAYDNALSQFRDAGLDV
jgi:hypothetical protein